MDVFPTSFLLFRNLSEWFLNRIDITGPFIVSTRHRHG